MKIGINLELDLTFDEERYVTRLVKHAVSKQMGEYNRLLMSQEAQELIKRGVIFFDYR